MPESWRERAKCKGHPSPDFFFPDKYGKAAKKHQEAVREYCKTCPVQHDCVMSSIGPGRFMPFGVWGGFTEEERAIFHKRMARKRPGQLVLPILTQVEQDGAA